MNPIHLERLPLPALRAFEAFARLGNIGLAAAELGITASAVSHQLSALEEFLERPLTQRQGRHLQLTAEGRQYFEVVSPAFSLLQSATAQLRRNQLPRRVTVSALPLLANVWLLKRLGAFSRLHAGIDIQLQYARYRNYSSDAADLSIRFGTGRWPGYESEKLLSGTAYPFASPAFVQRHGPLLDAIDIHRAPLIHDGKTEQWANWISEAGLIPPAPLRGLVCEDGMLTRSAMLADLGVALTRPPLIEDDLRAGRLVQLSERGLEDGQDYHLCVRTAAAPPPAPVRQLADWLRRG